LADSRVGFIGGSGLYDMDGIEDSREVRVETPFGDPSDAITVGTLDGVDVAFLPRHGRGHRLLPTEIPVRANIYALKSLGVQSIVSVSAVGSLKEHLKPLDLVVPDQIIDRTKSRPSTFFGDGVAAHIGFADPFCPTLHPLAVRSGLDEGADTHSGGTYVVMEGPQFSTRAESVVYRNWGAGVIGMTALPEAKLAREAEICYVTLAFVTDYDVWHQSEEEVSVELIVQNLLANVSTAQRIIRRMIADIPSLAACSCRSALESAIITSPDAIPERARERLGLLIDKYVKD
jgi:5'-methylthioadenosine phosphorylase